MLRCSSCLQTLTVQAVTTPLCKFIPCLWYTVCPYFPRRGYAGFQLPERGLFGNHYGTQLLQVPTLNSTQNRMGQQSGGPAGLHGEGSRAWCASNDMHEEFLMSPRRMSERFGFQSFRLVVVCVFRFISACVALSEQPGDAPLADVVIMVAGINHNVSTSRFGDYYRLLLPGTYNITVLAPGYVLYIFMRENCTYRFYILWKILWFSSG